MSAAALKALANLYDAVQRGDFDHTGVEGSEAAFAAREVLAEHDATFDQFFRRIASPCEIVRREP